MVAHEAYVEGFCKAAEAMGVDPVALCKQALPAWLGQVGARIAGAGRAIANSRVGQAVGRARNGLSRYGQLLTGSKYYELRDSAKAMTERIRNGEKALQAMESRSAAIEHLRRKAMGQVADGAVDMTGRFTRLNERAEAVGRRIGDTRAELLGNKWRLGLGKSMMKDEARKMMMAQWGTIAGLGGLGYGAYKLSGGGQPQAPAQVPAQVPGQAQYGAT